MASPVVLLDPYVPVPDGAEVLHEYRDGGRLVQLAGSAGAAAEAEAPSSQP